MATDCLSQKGGLEPSFSSWALLDLLRTYSVPGGASNPELANGVNLGRNMPLVLIVCIPNHSWHPFLGERTHDLPHDFPHDYAHD